MTSNELVHSLPPIDCASSLDGCDPAFGVEEAMTRWLWILMLVAGCATPTLPNDGILWHPRTKTECLAGGMFQGYAVCPPCDYHASGCAPICESPGQWCCPK